MSQWPEHQEKLASETRSQKSGQPETSPDASDLAKELSETAQGLKDNWTELRTSIENLTRGYLSLPDEKPDNDAVLLTEFASDLAKIPESQDPAQTILVAYMKKLEQFYLERLPLEIKNNPVKIN